MIKAASIAYAIFMALMTAILCFGFVLLFSSNKQIEDHYQLRAALVRQRLSTQTLAKAHFTTLDNEPKEFVIEPSKGIRAQLTKSPWGLLSVVKTKTLHNRDTFSQAYLMAWSKSEQDPVLYLRNNDERLKISGNTFIDGTIYASPGPLKRVTINGKQAQKSTHSGLLQVANKQIEPLEITTDLIPEGVSPDLVDALENRSLLQSFLKPTLYLEAANKLENISLKGNILVSSKDTLRLAASAQLEDVIITAPKIVVEKGFEGSAQLVATTAIELAQDVSLKYPSAIIVTALGSEKSRLSIDSNSQVQGAIIMQGNGLMTESNQQLILAENSLLEGFLYCDGILELYGDVSGSVYTSALEYKAKNSAYSNLLKDVKLTKLEQPQWFFRAPLNAFGQGLPMIIKKL